MAVNSEHISQGARMDAAAVAAKLQRSRRTADGWVACCPAHDDRTPSLSVSDGNGRVLVKCHAGCSQDAVLDAIEALGIQMRRPKQEADILHPLLDIESLAAAKGLTLETLKANRVGNAASGGVSFEYTDSDGEVVGAKYRKYLGGGADRGFSWMKGSRPCLYGLWRLAHDFANDGRVILCEGETDALTLWQHGYTALALPGASMWRDEWAPLIPEGAKVYVILEPDQGGRTVEAAIEKSPLLSRAHFIRMPEATKDPNALHISSEAGFIDDFDKLIAKAEPAEKYMGLPCIDLCDMHAHLIDSYVIKNFLPTKAEAWVLGMPGSGKTFFVTDMALHIANNLPWMGRRVRGGLVVYVGAENARSIERRVVAARDSNAAFKANAPLTLTPGPVNLKDPDSIEAIKRTVRAAEVRHGQKCVLVIIDTLSRAGGGKEDTEDFGACLEGTGRIKNELDTSVLLVHHVGKDPSRGGRGWSGINGGVDLEVIVTEEGDAKVATVSKARDGQDGDRFGFQLEVITLGRDSDDEPVTTCIVKRVDPPLQDSKRPSGKYQTAILKEAEEQTAEQPGKTWTQPELMEMCKSLDIGLSTARKAILNLRELGYFQPTIGGSKLTYHPKGKTEK